MGALVGDFMGIDINRLGPEAQKQALAKLLEQKAVKQSKYHNEKATRTMPNGEIRTFDSLREARRYDHLRMLYEAGAIQDLRLQQTFTLQEGYVAADGETVRPITYKADFVYTTLVEVKSSEEELFEAEKSYMFHSIAEYSKMPGHRPPYKGELGELGGFVFCKDGRICKESSVIEDVKGMKTDKYRMKYKMMLEHGYKITEV